MVCESDVTFSDGQVVFIVDSADHGDDVTSNHVRHVFVVRHDVAGTAAQDGHGPGGRQDFVRRHQLCAVHRHRDGVGDADAAISLFVEGVALDVTLQVVLSTVGFVAQVASEGPNSLKQKILP